MVMGVEAVIVLAALTAKVVIDVPRIEEGHNVFLPGGEANPWSRAGLPPDVYGAMAAEFDQAFRPHIAAMPRPRLLAKRRASKLDLCLFLRRRLRQAGLFPPRDRHRFFRRGMASARFRQ